MRAIVHEGRIARVVVVDGDQVIVETLHEGRWRPALRCRDLGAAREQADIADGVERERERDGTE